MQWEKAVLCFGFYVLFIRLLVGVPLSLRDRNQILSVNIKGKLTVSLPTRSEEVASVVGYKELIGC